MTVLWLRLRPQATWERQLVNRSTALTSDVRFLNPVLDTGTLYK